MRHLFSISAYSFDLDEYGGTSEAVRRINDAGADGIELLTGYFDPEPTLREAVTGVHLPYATDWYSVWTGDTSYIDIVSDDNIRYRSYGRNRDEIILTVRDAMVHAHTVRPTYGVFHASNTRMDEVMGFIHRDRDDDVIHAVAELLNGAVSSFPGGEPPFTILFENLWWPGLTMADDSGYRILKDCLNFDDWGLCLDTGHLMNHLRNCRDERESIEDVMNVIRKYPRDMTDRIDLIHLHMSLSADYRERCAADPMTFGMTSDDEMISRAYEHVCMIDQHRPFSDVQCTEIVRTLEPKYVTHEISAPTASGRLSGFAEQLSLFRS
ncbi:MAG: sugar phosphate isomerase/epimerase [Methanomassiliicoccaceae archaeon]|nr:sugar phosphate isomerase/epimerase [Methanomassiliicoccaceae archaeon]